MGIDVGIAVTVLIFALTGMLSGFWGQILRLGALASLYFVAPPVARVIEDPVRQVMSANATEFTVRGVALIAAALGLYAMMSLAIGLVLRAARRGRSMSGTNRFFGFALGAVKGSALCYLLLAGLVMVAHSRHYSAALATNDDWVRHASESRLVDFVTDNNLLEQMGYSLPSPEEIQEALDLSAEDIEAFQRVEGTGQGAEGLPSSGNVEDPSSLPSGPPSPPPGDSANSGAFPPTGAPGAGTVPAPP